MTTSDQSLNRQALYLAFLTVALGEVEAGVSIWSGREARSIALIGFGLDSATEIFPAFMVIWQLHGVSEERKRRALRSCPQVHPNKNGD